MLKTIKASHIAVGTELTTGQTLNTNSHFIASYLQKKGVLNHFHFVVDDNKERILQCLELASKDSDWIFVYGGLGPTSDDFTRNVISEWSQLPLQLNQEVWEYIQDYLRKRNYPVRDFQIQQAYFPKSSAIMKNSKGTAHGFHFEMNKKKFFIFPGPPKEIHSICENFLYQYIDENTKEIDAWVTHIWNTIGLGESEVANKIEPIVKKHSLVVGYRIHLPYVEVKVSFFSSQSQQFMQVINQIEAELRPILVYKDKSPFKALYLNFIQKHLDLEIQDEFTNNLFFEDLKSWSSEVSGLKIKYTNYIEPTKSLNLIQIKVVEEQKIQIIAKTINKNIQFEIDFSSVKLLPRERQILFAKELTLIKLLPQLQ